MIIMIMMKMMMMMMMLKMISDNNAAADDYDDNEHFDDTYLFVKIMMMVLFNEVHVLDHVIDHMWSDPVRFPDPPYGSQSGNLTRCWCGLHNQIVTI